MLGQIRCELRLVHWHSANIDAITNHGKTSSGMSIKTQSVVSKESRIRGEYRQLK